MPIFALSFGAAVEDLASRSFGLMNQVARVPLILITVALVVFPYAIIAAKNGVREQVKELIDATPRDACPVVWAFYMAWPAVELYGSRRPDITFIGEVPTASSVPSWNWRVRDIFPAYVAGLAAQLANRPGLCLLFSHLDLAERRREEAILLIANPSHPCTELVREGGAILYRCK
jgi:hypothetical protein